MTCAQIQVRLMNVGATNYEAELLAEIMHLNGWHEIAPTKPSNELKSHLRTWLADFREERALIAENIERDRSARVAAGYGR